MAEPVQANSSATTDAADAQVFDVLAQAQQQYREYLQVTATLELTQVWADAPVLPPSPETPLSLTIWQDR